MASQTKSAKVLRTLYKQDSATLSGTSTLEKAGTTLGGQCFGKPEKET
jgi:hypothetical protein